MNISNAQYRTDTTFLHHFSSRLPLKISSSPSSFSPTRSHPKFTLFISPRSHPHINTSVDARITYQSKARRVFACLQKKTGFIHNSIHRVHVLVPLSLAYVVTTAFFGLWNDGLDWCEFSDKMSINPPGSSYTTGAFQLPGNVFKRGRWEWWGILESMHAV